jgi:EAL domain-containing protein (putative c-di-GMP-specific phosphodiesterase class I)
MLKQMKNFTELSLAEDLRAALLTQQLELYLQPKIQLSTDSICGAEVLLRWKHPLHGVIATPTWIDIAEKHGLMKALTKWLITQTVHLLHSWQYTNLPLAINVSPTAFDAELCQFIVSKLAEKGLSTNLLEIEITESVQIENIQNVAASAHWLQSKGVKISLDDFGTGFSTMRYLVEIPTDCVKIDKTFVQQAPMQPQAKMVLKALIELAQEIGTKVICEGVETEEQLRLVQNLGCDIVQGFYFSKPLSLEAFLRINHQYAVVRKTDGRVGGLKKAS